MASKHVIFLGAGASKGSGYPLANELRLWLSSQDYYSQKALKLNRRASAMSELGGMVSDFFQANEAAVTFFRKGGFATVDEFCKLSFGHGTTNHAAAMRFMTRAALGLFNPEDSFENSEYYGFVQALF